MDFEILNKLNDARIFSLQTNDKLKTIKAVELCDSYFTLQLTTKDLQNLAAELQRLANKLKRKGY